jgi:hypothetical protein
MRVCNNGPRACHLPVGLVVLTILTGLAGLPASATAQDVAPRIVLDPVECFPAATHGIVRGEIENGVPGYTPRVYFRRLHQEVEDFYWVEMQPYEGRWWAALPQPEDHQPTRFDLRPGARAEPAQLRSPERWAAWWKAKELSVHRDPNGDLDAELIEERAQVGLQENRDWMIRRDDQAFEDWLETLNNEPIEYHAAMVDSYGRMVPGSRTPMTVAPVGENGDCTGAAPQNDHEAGAALNLTIGETAPWQGVEKLFHWDCHGLVTRIDFQGIPRADQVCRACVVGFRPAQALPVLAGVAAITIFEEPNPSPTAPGPR